MSVDDPDSTLVERVGRGEPAAARLLVSAKLPRILGLATRRLRDTSEAEDVAQETFLRVWRNAGAWEPGRARFDTWLHTVVRNLCCDCLRRRREVMSDTISDAADPTPGAESSLIERERGRAVANAIAGLPERQREAILLINYQRTPLRVEAAAALNVSVEALEPCWREADARYAPGWARRMVTHD